MAAIKITLETLYDILRNEKKREELQRLEDTFFVDLISYIREKRGLLEAKKLDQSMFSAAEREKLEYELRSIKRIAKELYEKREKKLLDIALNKSRTGSDLIDTSSMLPEEKELYRQSLSIMDSFRQSILYRLFEGEIPALPTTPAPLAPATLVQQRKEQLRAELEAASAKAAAQPKASAPLVASALPAGSSVKTKVKFVHPTPSFVWKDLKVYGPFDIGDHTEIFPEVADLLVRKGRAVKV